MMVKNATTWKARLAPPRSLWMSLLVANAVIYVLPSQAIADEVQSSVAVSSAPEVATVEASAEVRTDKKVTYVAGLNSDKGNIDTPTVQDTLAVPPPKLSQVNPVEPSAQAPMQGDAPSVTELSSTEGENQSDDPMTQVTNVTQLRDVSPGDWAFEALRSLVERYGCIAGYPDGTYRGNRSTSRYEFAAGLNACLQQIERIIKTSGEGFVTRQDLETLQRLAEEFKPELTTLGTRVDKLEGRVAVLEDHQFSTTTKLNGEVIFAISDLFGDGRAGSRAGNPEYANTETVFQDRVRLNFDTSFTGKDRLRTRLQAGNITEFGPLRGGFTPAIPGTNITREGRFGFQTDNGNSVAIDKLYYRFPFNDYATVFLFANAGNYDDFVPLLNPGLDPSGTGALSRFGRYSPIYRIGQPSQNAGVGLTFGPKSPIRIDVGYLGGSASNDPGEDAGIFNGSYSALGQVTFQPIKGFSVAATYVHAYSSNPDSAIGNAALGGALGHGTGSIGSQVNNTQRPVVSNSYGVEASFSFTPQLSLSGWGGYPDTTFLVSGDANVLNYAATLAINDFGTKGSTLGFVVGMEPKLTGTSNQTVATLINGVNGGRRKDPDTGLHVEGFYRFALTKNITITPGVIWLTAPGHNEDNDDIFIGTVRT